MKILPQVFYNLTIGLWLGGIFIFTAIVTPLIFKSYERDMAGDIVGKLFPGYFLYLTILSLVAFALVWFLPVVKTTLIYRISLALIVSAILVNLYVKYKLHPEIVQVKKEVKTSRETEHESEIRKKFGRLHGVSASLNLFLLADGIALVVFSTLFRKVSG